MLGLHEVQNLRNITFVKVKVLILTKISQNRQKSAKLTKESYLIARNVQAGFRIAEITDRWHFLDAVGVMILTHFLAHGMRVLRLGFDI